MSLEQENHILRLACRRKNKKRRIGYSFDPAFSFCFTIGINSFDGAYAAGCLLLFLQ